LISQFADIFVQMVVLFAVGATGYAAKRLNLMDEDFDKKFSKLILNTALPALILASVLTAETLPSATKILWTAGVSCASYVVLVAIGFSITAALRVPDGRKGVFRFMMVFGNTGFIGFPVTAGRRSSTRRCSISRSMRSSSRWACGCSPRTTNTA